MNNLQSSLENIATVVSAIGAVLITFFWVIHRIYYIFNSLPVEKALFNIKDKLFEIIIQLLFLIIAISYLIFIILESLVSDSISDHPPDIILSFLATIIVISIGIIVIIYFSSQIYKIIIKSPHSKKPLFYIKDENNTIYYLIKSTGKDEYLLSTTMTTKNYSTYRVLSKSKLRSYVIHRIRQYNQADLTALNEKNITEEEIEELKKHLEFLRYKANKEK